MAAVGACVADNELQFLPSIFHKLPLESSLLGFGGPGETLVHIEQPIKAKRESNQSPTHSLPDLQKHKEKQITQSSSQTDAHSQQWFTERYKISSLYSSGRSKEKIGHYL